MDIFNKIMEFLLDNLENFFDSFTIVNGRVNLRVLLFSFIYLAIAIVSKLLNIYCFIDIKSAICACVLLFIINCISTIQVSDINKFKKLLKGDNDDE